MRGTDELESAVRNADGITPACAGNRAPPARTGPRSADHPRVCGEQTPGLRAVEARHGSPPRVRGTAISFPLMKASLRITPACAGNSRGGPHEHILSQDHPRVCGEQYHRPVCGGIWRGSPPRVRGTVASAGSESSNLRITPACAGNRPIAWYYLA